MINLSFLNDHVSSLIVEQMQKSCGGQLVWNFVWQTLANCPSYDSHIEETWTIGFNRRNLSRECFKMCSILFFPIVCHLFSWWWMLFILEASSCQFCIKANYPQFFFWQWRLPDVWQTNLLSVRHGIFQSEKSRGQCSLIELTCQKYVW